MLLIFFLSAAVIFSSDRVFESSALRLPPSLPKHFNNLLSFFFFPFFYSFFLTSSSWLTSFLCISLLIHYVTMNLSSNTEHLGMEGEGYNYYNMWEEQQIILVLSLQLPYISPASLLALQMIETSWVKCFLPALSRGQNTGSCQHASGQYREATTEVVVWSAHDIKWCRNY